MSSGHDYFDAGRAGSASDGCRPRAAAAYDRIIGTHDATHYEVLGIAPNATQAEIRAAYLARARRRHPDVAHRVPADAAADAASMAELNRAYQVLGRPQARQEYDRRLRQAASAGEAAARPDSGPDPDPDPDLEPTPASSPASRMATSVLTPSGPARMPWMLMLIAAVVGSGIVIASAALSESPRDEEPDGILRVGSCVEIESNGDVREISCATDDTHVVGLVLPTGSTCPPAYATHRGRLGLGAVCVETDG